MSDSANVRQISDVEAWSIEQRAYDILTGRRIRPLNKHEQKVYADIITRATSDGWFPSFKMGFAVLVPFMDATARTAYVDQYGRLGLSYELIYALPFEEQVTIIVHEVMHMLSNHITRGKALGFADLLDCNIVSDLEVNTALERSPKAVLTTGILPQNYNLPVMKTMEWYFKNWNDDLTELKERQQEDPTNGLPKPQIPPPPSQDGSNDPKEDSGQQPNQDAGDNSEGDSQNQDNSQGDGDNPQEDDYNQGDDPDSNEDTQAKPDSQDRAPTQEGSQDDTSGDPTDTSANGGEDSSNRQDPPATTVTRKNRETTRVLTLMPAITRNRMILIRGSVVHLTEPRTRTVPVPLATAGETSRAHLLALAALTRRETLTQPQETTPTGTVTLTPMRGETVLAETLAATP